MFQDNEEVNKFAEELNNIICNKDIDMEKYLILQVADDEYAIPVGKIRNILPMKKITKISGSSKYIKGVLSISDEVVPVCSIYERVTGVEKENSKFEMLAIVDTLYNNKSKIIGIMSDKIIEVRAISKIEIGEKNGKNSSFGSEYIKTIVKNNDKFTLILDVDKLIENY